MICVIYEDGLKRLKIYSFERRERYMIIYMYKIAIDLVPNLGLEWTYNERNQNRGESIIVLSLCTCMGQNNTGQKFLLERTQTLQHSTNKHEETRRHKNYNQKIRVTV